MTDRMRAHLAYERRKQGAYVVDSQTSGGVAGPFASVEEARDECFRVARRDGWSAGRLVVATIGRPDLRAAA